MRLKMITALIFATSQSVFASTSAAQDAAQHPSAQPPQSAQGPQPSVNPAVPGQRQAGRVMGGGPDMMTSDMMQTMGPMSCCSRNAGERGLGLGEPLQRISKLLAALDDPRVRTVLGLTDQQAESLRKIVVDTETFTIKTGADIAVDSIDLRELLRADKPDRAAVMRKGDEISKSTSALINRLLDALLAAKAILTPEQQKMIRAYMERGASGFPAPRARP